MIRKRFYIYICGLLCLLAACAKTDAKTGNTNAAAADSGSEQTANQTVEGEEKTELMYEEIIKLVEDSLGEGYAECISDSGGVKDGALYSIYLKIKPDQEEKVLNLVTSLCGEGQDVSSRSLPRMKNEVCDKLNEAEPIRVYDYLRQGENGAKTKSTEIFTARLNGDLYVFIFQ